MNIKDPVLRGVLTQPANSEERFFALDGLRAIAFFLVLLAHSVFCLRIFFDDSQSYLNYLFSFPAAIRNIFLKGDLALDIFFVFSAFLLGVQLIEEIGKKHTLNTKWYFIKRILRIYPPYILALIFFGIPSAIAGAGNYGYMWANLLGINNLLSLENIFLVWTWSISVEIQFYIVCPALAFLAVKHPKVFITTLLSLLVLSLCWRFFYLVEDGVFPKGTTFFDMFINDDKETSIAYFDKIYMHTISRLPAFVFGLFAAFIYVKHKVKALDLLQSRYISLLLHFICFSCIVWVVFGMNLRESVGALLISDQQWSRYYFELITFRFIFSLGISLLILLMLFKAYGSVKINRVLSAKWMYPISQTSYSMYLFHPIFLWPPYLICKHFNLISNLGWVQPVFITTLVFFVSFMFGLFMYKYVEYPFLRGKFYRKYKTLAS